MANLHLLAIVEAYTITGPAKNLLEFARLAADQQVATTFLTFTRGNGENQFTQAVRQLASEHPQIGLEIIQERGAFDLGVVRSLRSAIERLQPDVIQTHAVKSHFLLRFSGLSKTTPWVAFHHGYTWPNLKMRLYNQLDRWSLLAADKILTVSTPFREQLTERGIPRERVEIIHNAISPGWGEAASVDRKQFGIPEHRKVALIVGRLSREKDHATLLNAISRINPKTRPHLVIVGDGPEHINIEHQVETLQLGAFVTLVGQQKSAEPWYGLADVAVLSSLSEGSPNALLEAMAARVPVVATSVGGIPEIVTHNESALLVKAQDPASLSAAIETVLTNTFLAERLKARAHRLIVEQHDPIARTQKLSAIYRMLQTEAVPARQAVATS